MLHPDDPVGQLTDQGQPYEFTRPLRLITHRDEWVKATGTVRHPTLGDVEIAVWFIPAEPAARDRPARPRHLLQAKLVRPLRGSEPRLAAAWDYGQAVSPPLWALDIQQAAETLWELSEKSRLTRRSLRQWRVRHRAWEDAQSPPARRRTS